VFGRMSRARESGFTVLELILVMTVIGILASVGVTAYAKYQEHTRRMEATAAWHELSMAVNLYRTANGTWPRAYIAAEDLDQDPNGNRFFAIKELQGALLHNLAPSLPVLDKDATGYLILSQGRVCVWVGGVPADPNEENGCPSPGTVSVL